MIKTITFPDGIRRKGKNIEGSELYDCDDEEIDCLEKDLEQDDEINVPDAPKFERDTVFKPKEVVPLASLCHDEKLKADAQFSDDLQSLLEKYETSPRARCTSR